MAAKYASGCGGAIDGGILIESATLPCRGRQLGFWLHSLLLLAVHYVAVMSYGFHPSVTTRVARILTNFANQVHTHSNNLACRLVKVGSPIALGCPTAGVLMPPCCLCIGERHASRAHGLSCGRRFAGGGWSAGNAQNGRR